MNVTFLMKVRDRIALYYTDPAHYDALYDNASFEDLPKLPVFNICAAAQNLGTYAEYRTLCVHINNALGCSAYVGSATQRILNLDEDARDGRLAVALYHGQMPLARDLRLAWLDRMIEAAEAGLPLPPFFTKAELEVMAKPYLEPAK